MRTHTEVPTQTSYGIHAQHRLPNGTHVGGVTLQVSDLQRSIDYYSNVLGMALLDREREVAPLAPGATGQPLVTLREKKGVARVPRTGRFGLYHFALLLPDRSSLGRFAAHLSAVPIRHAMADHAVSEALYLTDPDGLGIEVYADRPRNTWRRRDNELVMVTEPLDIADVIAAGKGEAWTQMPVGTVMGHMHLHVGAIKDAEAFYHATIGFDKTVWTYPGALFMSAGGYHHHLATNVWSPGPSAGEDEARLLDWELVVPSVEDARRVAQRVIVAGYSATEAEGAWVAVDPWGTRVKIVSEHTWPARRRSARFGA